MSTLIDFSNLQKEVRKIKNEYEIEQISKAFVFYGVQSVLGINDTEVFDSITDGTQDRGIDAIYIEEDEDLRKKNIHLFQFKYTDNFDKINNHFQSNETHKMMTFINQVFKHGKSDLLNVNNILKDKVEDIVDITKEGELGMIYIHFCSNLNNGLIESEKINFEESLKEDFGEGIDFKYFTIKDFIENSNKKPSFNGILRVVDDNYFTTEDGQIGGIICQIEVSDLINLILDNNGNVKEGVFYDNVRVYLGSGKKRSINEKIKESAIDVENNFKFFYFNNGITITCSDFTYKKGIRSPNIEMQNFQIVNGQQTIKTLLDVYQKDKEKLSGKVLLLVRVYRTKGEDAFEVSQKIAEYTNSQNPVKLRDIRANDEIQKKYSKALSLYGYYYENKKNLHIDKEKLKRIDAEQLGQILLSFYVLNPGDASNKKSLIYGDEYEKIFRFDLTGSELLFPYLLFKKLEREKENFRKKFLKDEMIEFTFIKYATFTILYYIGFKIYDNGYELKDLKSEQEIISHVEEIFVKYYNEAINLIKEAVDIEKKRQGDSYTHNNFFKNNFFKKYFEKKKIISYSTLSGREDLNKKGNKYYLKTKGANAIGIFDGKGITVLKGSRLVSEITNSGYKNNIDKRRRKLLDEGIIEEKEGKLFFKKDYYSTLNVASTIIGHPVNAWNEWKKENGKTLDELERNFKK